MFRDIDLILCPTSDEKFIMSKKETIAVGVAEKAIIDSTNTNISNSNVSRPSSRSRNSSGSSNVTIISFTRWHLLR